MATRSDYQKRAEDLFSTDHVFNHRFQRFIRQLRQAAEEEGINPEDALLMITEALHNKALFHWGRSFTPAQKEKLLSHLRGSSN